MHRPLAGEGRAASKDGGLSPSSSRRGSIYSAGTPKQVAKYRSGRHASAATSPQASRGRGRSPERTSRSSEPSARPSSSSIASWHIAATKRSNGASKPRASSFGSKTARSTVTMSARAPRPRCSAACQSRRLHREHRPAGHVWWAGPSVRGRSLPAESVRLGKGGSYARLWRTLETGNLTLVQAAAAELPRRVRGERRAQVMDASGRLDPGCLDCRCPLAAAEVVQVQQRAAIGREKERPASSTLAPCAERRGFQSTRSVTPLITR